MSDEELPLVPHHRVLRQLGEGGMGLVYEAEQVEPLRRRVALKVLKAGMDTKAFIGRFEAERQALAVMDHVGIARVYDAGSTSEGRPYYTMEYVAGVPLTEFCDAERLGTRERVQLMIDICRAVHHAHEKGIIHRDLKPSNLLVMRQGGHCVPKVIDFGIAKALQGRLSDRTFATELYQLLGTPSYMSPEQWDGGPTELDPRADVYSLGVVLYELLVGVLPYDPNSLLRAGAAAPFLLRDSTPSTPSNRVHSMGGGAEPTAKFRGTDPSALTRQVRGDLDWITLKALESDRNRRYASALALAEDLERHLRSEPVVARPPTLGYRVGRFVRRHRTASIGVVLVLALGAWFARQRQADLAFQKASNELRSDLRNLVMGQESYFTDHSRYATTMSQLRGLYRPSRGVKVDIVAASDSLWMAVASSVKMPQFSCAIYFSGGQTPGIGEPTCTQR